MIADVHGNAPALDAVLAELENERPDLIVVAGDVAGGPHQDEVLDRLMRLERARLCVGEEVSLLRGQAFGGPRAGHPPEPRETETSFEHARGAGGPNVVSPVLRLDVSWAVERSRRDPAVSCSA